MQIARLDRLARRIAELDGGTDLLRTVADSPGPVKALDEVTANNHDLALSADVRAFRQLLHSEPPKAASAALARLRSELEAMELGRLQSARGGATGIPEASPRAAQVHELVGQAIHRATVEIDFDAGPYVLTADFDFDGRERISLQGKEALALKEGFLVGVGHQTKGFRQLARVSLLAEGNRLKTAGELGAEIAALVEKKYAQLDRGWVK